MRDGPTEGTRLGALLVDVDPLEVVGGLGELVDPFLGDLDPVRGADLLTGGGFDLLEGAEHAHVRRSSGRIPARVLDGQRVRTYRSHSRPDQGAPEGAAARPPRRRTAPRDDRRARPGRGPHAAGRRRGSPRAVVHRVSGQRLARALPRDLRPHRGGDAARRPPHPCGPRVRGGPRRRRGGVRRGPLRPRAAPPRRAHPRGGRPRGAGGVRRGRWRRPAGRPDRRTPAPDRDAAPGALARDRRAGGRPPGRRCGRVRHRRCGGRLPAHPAPGRVRVPPARERPLHDPRRRGVRAAVDLAGDPVVRSGPARSRRPHHRRHQRGRGRGRGWAGWRSTSATSASPSSCARTPTSRPVPSTRSPTTRSACWPASGSASP